METKLEKPATTKRPFLIYPDSRWNTEKWGPPPLLGKVYAEDAFTAIRKAYDAKLIRVNFTFDVKAIPVRDRRPKPKQET